MHSRGVLVLSLTALLLSSIPTGVSAGNDTDNERAKGNLDKAETQDSTDGDVVGVKGKLNIVEAQPKPHNGIFGVNPRSVPLFIEPNLYRGYGIFGGFGGGYPIFYDPRYTPFNAFGGFGGARATSGGFGGFPGGFGYGYPGGFYGLGYRQYRQYPNFDENYPTYGSLRGDYMNMDRFPDVNIPVPGKEHLPNKPVSSSSEALEKVTAGFDSGATFKDSSSDSTQAPSIDVKGNTETSTGNSAGDIGVNETDSFSKKIEDVPDSGPSKQEGNVIPAENAYRNISHQGNVQENVNNTLSPDRMEIPWNVSKENYFITPSDINVDVEHSMAGEGNNTAENVNSNRGANIGEEESNDKNADYPKTIPDEKTLVNIDQSAEKTANDSVIENRKTASGFQVNNLATNQESESNGGAKHSSEQSRKESVVGNENESVYRQANVDGGANTTPSSVLENNAQSEPAKQPRNESSVKNEDVHGEKEQPEFPSTVTHEKIEAGSMNADSETASSEKISEPTKAVVSKDSSETDGKSSKDAVYRSQEGYITDPDTANKSAKHQDIPSADELNMEAINQTFNLIYGGKNHMSIDDLREKLFDFLKLMNKLPKNVTYSSDYNDSLDNLLANLKLMNFGSGNGSEQSFQERVSGSYSTQDRPGKGTGHGMDEEEFGQERQEM